MCCKAQSTYYLVAEKDIVGLLTVDIPAGRSFTIKDRNAATFLVNRGLAKFKVKGGTNVKH